MDRLKAIETFVRIAQTGSLSKAAQELGMSRALASTHLRQLEDHLGARLLNRTTRRVGPTEAGTALAATLRPCFDEIEAQIARLGALRDQPAGLVRITASALAAETILWPVISRLLPDYPDVKVEVNVESRFTDIVAERFDAGVRLGESLEQDMVAVRISPDFRMALVAAPAYVARHGMPASPQELVNHSCINLRLPAHGGLYAWDFVKNGDALHVNVQGAG